MNSSIILPIILLLFGLALLLYLLKVIFSAIHFRFHPGEFMSRSKFRRAEQLLEQSDHDLANGKIPAALKTLDRVFALRVDPSPKADFKALRALHLSAFQRILEVSRSLDVDMELISETSTLIDRYHDLFRELIETAKTFDEVRGTRSEKGKELQSWASEQFVQKQNRITEELRNVDERFKNHVKKTLEQVHQLTSKNYVIH